MPPHKLTFLVAFVFSIREFTHAQFYSYSEPTCTSEQCRFLFEKLVLQSRVGEPCKDFQYKVCYWRNDYDGYDLSERDPEVIKFEAAIEKNLTEKLVNSYTGDLRSIYQEKDLYQQCQKLGFPEGRNIDNSERSWSSSKRFSEMVNLAQGIGTENWKTIDKQLYDLGFGYAFFDIKVVPDPKNVNKNIILLETPSASSLDATRKILFTHYRTIENIFTMNARSFKESVDSFFESWVEAANKTMESPYIQFPNKRMSLEEWDNKFNNHYDDHYVVNINWVTIITQIFRQVNITINQYTPIIVKNEGTYFEKLYYLLRDTPNDVIAATLLYKAATENLRYVDWKLVQLLNNAEKHTFCFNNIKLYGISFRFFHDITSANEVHYKKLKYTVYNTIQSIRNQIERSSLSITNEIYLLNELESITAGVFTDFESKEYWNYISDYYGDFDISDNYFDSIVNYRKLLKNKELSSLESNPKKTPRPFSVTDSRLLYNRFLLYICYMMYEMSRISLPENLPKQYYYGTYGTKIASFLYALLEENKFENTEVNYAVEKSSKQFLTIRPDYTREMLLCHHTSPNKKMVKEEYATQKISELFGVQIAYEAMKLDTSYNMDKDMERETFPQNTEFGVNHYFFLSYAASHCRKYREIVNAALSTQDFVDSFNCNNETIHFQYHHNECKIKMFDSFNNRALLIKL